MSGAPGSDHSNAPSRKQTWDAGGYDRHGRFVSDRGGDALLLLDPKAGEEILDLGCGDGALTEKIAETGAKVMGVDLSDSLLDAARAKGLDVQKMDAEALAFENKFDAVFSNAALHWMADADKVIDGVRRALKSGGRFVGEFGGHGNLAAVITTLRAVGNAHGADISVAGPWFYPTEKEYRHRLEQGGFEVTDINLIPRPTPLPSDMAGWLQTFRKPFFDQFAGEEREKVLEEAVTLLEPCLRDSGGTWTADYVRLRFRAVLRN